MDEQNQATKVCMLWPTNGTEKSNSINVIICPAYAREFERICKNGTKESVPTHNVHARGGAASLVFGSGCTLYVIVYAVTSL
jgi:hypothetical protein